MLGIDNTVIEHILCIYPESKKMQKTGRSFRTEKCTAIAEEIDRLLEVGFIREAHYPEWLSNVMLVKKANGKCKMCVDFTNLNKAYHNESFPLPRIDIIVDAIAGHKSLSFMDAYSGHNEIRMNKADEEKTTFIIARGLYCYRKHYQQQKS